MAKPLAGHDHITRRKQRFDGCWLVRASARRWLNHAFDPTNRRHRYQDLLA